MTTAAITIETVDAPLGAIAHGLNPAEPVGPADLAQLTDALATHGVLVMHDVQLSAAELSRFAHTLGEVHGRPEPEQQFTRLVDHEGVRRFSNVRADGTLADIDEPLGVFLRGMQRWQTDDSFRANPARYSVQHAAEVPGRGGQTQFADMRRALTLLPLADRREMSGQQLVHSYAHWWTTHPGHLPRGIDTESLYPPVEHPWIHSSNDGSESLFMGAFASQIVDDDTGESRRRFEEIEAQLSVHDVFYEHHWRPNDLLLWNNRFTMHRDLGFDIANERRVMHQVVIA